MRDIHSYLLPANKFYQPTTHFCRRHKRAKRRAAKSMSPAIMVMKIMRRASGPMETGRHVGEDCIITCGLVCK